MSKHMFQRFIGSLLIYNLFLDLVLLATGEEGSTETTSTKLEA